MKSRELEDIWASRDGRYVMRRYMGNKSPLTPSEESSIIAYRRREVERLIAERSEQFRALAVLSNWQAPLVV